MLATILKWCLGNWRTVGAVLFIVGATGFVTKFYMDYRGLKDDKATLEQDVRDLEQDLEDQKGATAAALEAAEKFDEKFKELEDDLERLGAENAGFARRLGSIRRELDAADLGNLVRVDPAAAGVAASDAVNAFGKLHECATSGAPNCADRGSDTAGQDPSAAP